jgi:hypothetical protein
MGFWSSVENVFKKVVKKVWQVVKAVVRFVVRIVATFYGLIVGLFDLFFGFFTWPQKKLKYHIFILSTDEGPLVDPGQVAASIDYLTQTFKDKLNVKVDSYGKPGVEVITAPAPKDALDVGCGADLLGNEFGDAGEFFAQHVAGWNAIPISLTFPVTIFIVRSVAKGDNKIGCSLGPLADWVVVDSGDGLIHTDTIAHEVGHACNLWHVSPMSNLMHASVPRGNDLKWWQKNLARSSRHVYY